MTTYDIALMDQDFLSQIPWHYAIIDEAQRLKNPSSVSGHIIYAVILNSGFNWLLTVTLLGGVLVEHSDRGELGTVAQKKTKEYLWLGGAK